MDNVLVVSGHELDSRSRLLDLALSEESRREKEKRGAKALCGDSTWGKMLPPSSGDYIGKYKLLRCLGGGAYGEAWTAKADDGIRLVVVKISKSARADLQSECLFSQLITQRDPVHFVDCLEFGTSSSGDSIRYYMVQDLAAGKPLLSLLSNETFSGDLLQTISVWMQLADAYEMMYTTNAESQFKFVNRDIHSANVMIDVVKENHEPNVKIIDYGLGIICCIGGKPEACEASLRDGSTTNKIQPTRLPMCENLLESELLGLQIRSQALALVKNAAHSLDTEALMNLMQAKKVDRPGALKLVALSPLDFMPARFRQQVSVADRTKPGIRKLLHNVLVSLFGILLDEEIGSIETCIPSALPSNLRKVHAMLGSIKDVLSDVVVSSNASKWTDFQAQQYFNDRYTQIWGNSAFDDAEKVNRFAKAFHAEEHRLSSGFKKVMTDTLTKLGAS